VIHASFVDTVIATPYAVMLDAAKRTVVITIRGTLSLADALKDARWVGGWVWYE
jgi:hypothetical protein